MNESELNYLDRVINLAFDNAISNTRNGTAYQYYWENPALKQERLRPESYVRGNTALAHEAGRRAIHDDRVTEEAFKGSGLHASPKDVASIYRKQPTSGVDKVMRLLSYQQLANSPVLPNDYGPTISPPEKPAQAIDWERHPGKKSAYSDYVLKYLSQNKERIIEESKKAGVPPVAVAMAIGDELQTRKDDFFKLKGVSDWIQDYAATKLHAPNGTGGDIGPGNIRVGTAKKIRQEQGWDLSDMDLQNYILSDEGTAHLAALAMQEVQTVMTPHLDQEKIPKHEFYQHLVEGYREGPHNRMKRRLENQKQLPILQKKLEDGTLDYEEKRQLEQRINQITSPMNTGVPSERSDFRAKQIEWILDGIDTKEYGHEGLMRKMDTYSWNDYLLEKERELLEKELALKRTTYRARIAYENLKYELERNPMDPSRGRASRLTLQKLKERVDELNGWDINFPLEQELNRLKQNPQAFQARMNYEKMNNEINYHSKNLPIDSTAYKLLTQLKNRSDSLGTKIR